MSDGQLDIFRQPPPGRPRLEPAGETSEAVELRHVGDEWEGLGQLALPAIADGLPLALVRARFAEELPDGGRCPCCDQHAQIYRWSLYSVAAQALIALYRLGGTSEFVESQSLKRLVPRYQGDCTRLRFWGLVEHEPERRPDGGKSGWWRVTPDGQAFVLAEAMIPRYVYTYQGEVLRSGGEPRSIIDALGKGFDYRAMMDGEF